MYADAMLATLVAIGCILLAVAVWSDMRAHRIPNWLVLALAVTGLGHQVLVHGAVGTLLGLGGLATGIAFFIAFYIGRGMGAGDVKLMGAAGTMLGPLGALLAGAFSLVAGLLLVLGARQLTHLSHRHSALRAIPDIFVRRNESVRVPYAPAIAVGCGIAMWQRGIFSTFVTVAG